MDLAEVQIEDTDINLNNKKTHFKLLLMAEGMQHCSYQENIKNSFCLQTVSSAEVTMQRNVAFYNRFILLTDGRLRFLSKHPKYVSVQHEMQHYERICETL